jgi:hypothetical protein
MFRTYDFIKDSYLQDVASATQSYYGFYVPSKTGTAVDTAKAQFLLLSVKKDVSGNITEYKWSGRSYDGIWNDRATVKYD